MTQRGGGMSRHTITVGIVAWVLLLFSVVLNVRRAVAMQANAWLGSPVWTMAEKSNEILLCCGGVASTYWGRETPEFDKRLSRSLPVQWGNTIARWETRYPEAVGRMILYDLVTVTAISHEPLQQENTSTLEGEGPESAKVWESTGRAETRCCEESAPSLFETIHEQPELVASANASQGHPALPLQREKRTPTEKEAMREDFVLEPIHLVLLGSGLIGLGMLRNRHKRV